MINVTELRVLNIVNYLGRECVVSGIRAKGEIRLYPNNKLLEEDIDGIILTPEIMERSGFITASSEADSKKLWGIGEGDGPRLSICQDADGTFWNWRHSVQYKYLHHLQNLYFGQNLIELSIHEPVKVSPVE